MFVGQIQRDASRHPRPRPLGPHQLQAEGTPGAESEEFL